jgi:hypothetical protein
MRSLEEEALPTPNDLCFRLWKLVALRKDKEQMDVR